MKMPKTFKELYMKPVTQHPTLEYITAYCVCVYKSYIVFRVIEYISCSLTVAQYNKGKCLVLNFTTDDMKNITEYQRNICTVLYNYSFSYIKLKGK